MEEIKKPEIELPPKNEEDRYLVTSVISEENNKEYFLYSDGNLYEKDNSGNFVILDNVAPESKKIIEKIMEKFKPGKTDIIRPEEIGTSTKKDIEVDVPEL